MSWTLYKNESGGAPQRYTTPMVTVDKTGRIWLNRALVEKLPKMGYTQLYYDADENKIGIKMFSKQEEYTRIIRVDPSKSRWGISAKSFFRHFKIPTDKTQQYPAVYDESKRLIIVRLQGRDGKEGRQ
jgi:hypothetical protein